MKFCKIFLFLFLLVFTLNFISPQPPFQQDKALVNGYEIKIPFFGVTRQNSGFDFHFHVFNISDGVPITNDSTSCSFHLYNSTGNHIVSNNNIPYKPEEIINEWGIDVDGGNFSGLGDYSYLVQCNSSSSELGGFESVNFEVTADGKQFQVFPTQLSIIILCFFFVMCGFWNERLRMFKHLGSICLMIMGVITLYPGYSFINWSTLVGKALGFSCIALGFYFLIEDSFSRNKQEEHYDQEPEGDYYG